MQAEVPKDESITSYIIFSCEVWTSLSFTRKWSVTQLIENLDEWQWLITVSWGRWHVASMTDWALPCSLGMLIISSHVFLWWLYVAHARKASISKRCHWQDMGIYSLECKQRLVHPGPWARHIKSQTYR